MDASPAPPDANNTLAVLGRRIHCSLRSLERDLESQEAEDPFTSAIMNESQRFGLWAKNLGLYDLGHSSLDYRFRDAPVVYKHTRHLLVDLEKSIWKIQQDLDQRRPGRELVAEQEGRLKIVSNSATEISRDYDEDQYSDESSEDEEALMSYQEHSISTIILENARLIIDRLYKLSFKIRRPAMRLGFSKARNYREIDGETGMDLMDWYVAYDLRHVTEIIAPFWGSSQEECESHELVQRLARANTHRRRQFGHWRKHGLKMESAFAQAIPMLSNIPQGSVKSANSLPSTATRLDERNFNLSDTASVNSFSTYTSSYLEDDENEISIPPLPDTLRTGTNFECPYCHVLCSKRMFDKRLWAHHVIKDLRPYVCTYGNCTEGDQQYDNMEDWVNHEDRLHREGNRQLRDPSRQTFDVQGPSQNLTKSLHQIQHPKPMIPSDVWGEKCPICLKPSPSLAHVALHLRRIAVFTLPRSGEPEEDSTLGDQGSNTANIDDQESVSSLSTFETSDQGVLHEDEANDDWGQWDTNTPRDVVPTEIARQEDVQQLEHTLMGSRLKPHVATSPDCTLYSTSFFSTSLPKQKNNDRPASVAVAAMINLSFYVRIDPLEPDYKDQPARQGRNLFWVPSIVRSEFTRRDGTLFRWMGGIMTVVGTNDPVRCSLNRTHSAATVFTQHPDTPHLLVVPFDAQMRHPHQNSGGWQPLSFQHLRMNDTQRIYSAVSATGDRQHIAAPGSPHWMPQLLPRIYDDRKAGSPRIQAGLIGSLPLLLALAAFSAPPGVLAVVLINCVRSMTWRPHQYQYPAGHIPERGMVVTIFFDPANPQGSNAAILNRLQEGEFGPFYS